MISVSDSTVDTMTFDECVRRNGYVKPSEMSVDVPDDLKDAYCYAEAARPIGIVSDATGVPVNEIRDGVLAALSEFADDADYDHRTDSHGTMHRQHVMICGKRLHLCAEVFDYDRVWMRSTDEDGRSKWYDAYSAALYLSYDLHRIDIAAAIDVNDGTMPKFQKVISLMCEAASATLLRAKHEDAAA